MIFIILIFGKYENQYSTELDLFSIFALFYTKFIFELKPEKVILKQSYSSPEKEGTMG